MAKFTGKVMSEEGNKQLSRDDAPYRINSRDYTVTSGEHCAIQSKPNMVATGSAGITPFESSPRFAAGVAGGKIVGYMSNPILKTTALLPGGNCGPMRCYEGKLETGVHSTRTVTVMCVLEAMSDVRGTVTQGPTVVLVNKGDYKVWESVMELKGNEAGIWKDDPATEPSTAAGYIKVIVNANARYIQLYSTAPTD
jgi:hypothetical protein